MMTTSLICLLAILAVLQSACFLKLCAAASALRDMRQETAARLNMLDQQVTKVLGRLDEMRDAILDGQKDLHKKLSEDHADLGDGQTSILQRLEGLAESAERQHLDVASWFRSPIETQAAICENLAQCTEQVGDIHKVVVMPAETGPDRDAQLSKAMEEGVMNLMRYAAGKVPGVEVSLG